MDRDTLFLEAVDACPPDYSSGLVEAIKQYPVKRDYFKPDVHALIRLAKERSAQWRVTHSQLKVEGSSV